MAQAGNLVCWRAGENLGDSIYEARLFVRGGQEPRADCIEKDLTPDDRNILKDILARAGINGEAKPEEFRLYGSARTLYHFHVDNAAPIDERYAPRALFCHLRSYSIAEIQRAAAPASMTFAARTKRKLPISTICCFWAPRCRAIAGGLSREMRYDVIIGAAMPKAVAPEIPITIAGMSFGALSAPPRSVGRGASLMGTSTTTGDGGMTQEERGHSSLLVYQVLPSRYGANPMICAGDAIEM